MQLNWGGWMNPRSGYGIVNLEYATALERLTKHVSIGWEREEHVLPEDFQALSPEQKRLLTKPYTKEAIGIIKTTPQMFYKCENLYRIGYTMVENTKIGENWVKYCNDMDALFVPSQFLVQVFQECGVTKPIRVVKQGINSEQFPRISRRRKDKYIFGTVGYMDERKNWDALIEAFCSEFDHNEPVELWIKNSNKYFAHHTFTDKRIKVINRFYSMTEMITLYSLFDCFVFPSHAEGSGLPPREAMATGLPVILTDWSGLSEVCNPKFNYPIKPIAVDVPDVRGPEQPGFMARIEVEELMYWMRHVFEHQTEAREKGKLASTYMHTHWNWDTCAKDLVRQIKSL